MKTMTVPAVVVLLAATTSKDGVIHTWIVAAGIILAVFAIERFWSLISRHDDEGPLDTLKRHIVDDGVRRPPPGMIRVDCPACGKAYSLTLKLAGKKASCGKCGTKLSVPNPPPPP
jgi:hypothetical protein